MGPAFSFHLPASGQAITFLTLAPPGMSMVRDSCVLGAFEGGVMQHTKKKCPSHFTCVLQLDRHVKRTPLVAELWEQSELQTIPPPFPKLT